MTVFPLPIRLAILEADVTQPGTREKVGLYRDVFAALLAKATAPQDLSAVLDIRAYDVVGNGDGNGDAAAAGPEYPALEDIDALLITGSRHTAFDDDPWIVRLVEFARRAIDGGRVRVVGVCFGHQVVGRAMGARVGKSDKGWEVAVTDVDLTARGREVFRLDRLRIHQMHRDVVFGFPEGAVPLAHNAKCAVQAMVLPGRYLTVQGHPEFTGDIVREILEKRRAAGVFSDEAYGEGVGRAGAEHDGVAVARAFVRFMRGES
ncbi:putative glutamine amidotransferase-like protein [Escovopsis weberi]|uniref:Putative glutamine amidotransferase-like protein n=1 Tax=Escovopsis weberi TaxID=150374 RepID=A0A0M8N5I4_ESCWE|nr:putative glutamine amidotransferase-like protein [Escovopsis weberi]